MNASSPLSLRLTSLGLILGTIATLTSIESAPSQAITRKYFCAIAQGVPRTFVKKSRGNVPIINWMKNYGDIAPRERCIIVSNRFQRFSDNQTLKQIVTGMIERQPVLCAVATQQEICQKNNVLVTLPTNVDRFKAAQELMDVFKYARGRPVLLGGNKLENYNPRTGENYYDMEVLERLLEEVETPVTEELIPLER
jgi:hypothetical protein